MRILSILICIILLLGTIPAYAAPAYIQSRGADNDRTAQLSMTFSNPVKSGSLLVLAIRIGNGNSATVTSTGGRTWTRDKSLMGPVSGWRFEVHSLANAPAGTTTVTATVPGGADVVRMLGHEYSGIATSDPVHKSSSAEGTSGTAIAGSVTTTIDNCLLFCSIATDSDGMGFRAGQGYTLRGNPVDAGDKVCSEDSGPVATGTYTGTMYLNSDSWAAILVAYKPSTGGSVPSTPAAPTNLHKTP